MQLIQDLEILVKLAVACGTLIYVGLKIRILLKQNSKNE